MISLFKAIGYTLIVGALVIGFGILHQYLTEWFPYLHVLIDYACVLMILICILLTVEHFLTE